MSVLTLKRPFRLVTLPPPHPGLPGAAGGDGALPPKIALQMARRTAAKEQPENRRPVHARQTVFAGSFLGTHGNLEMSTMRQPMLSALLMLALQSH